jgi:hypothetical protein
MIKTLLLVVLAGAGFADVALAQPPADCRPNALNIPGAPYPCVLPDNRVMFRVAAPDAQKVRVRVGKGFDMTKEADGLWHVTTTPQVIGFHYYTIQIDGAVVADPATRCRTRRAPTSRCRTCRTVRCDSAGTTRR